MSEEARNLIKNFVEEDQKQRSTGRVNYFGGLAESAFQGATFGFGDEIEAAIRKVVSPEKTYAECYRSFSRFPYPDISSLIPNKIKIKPYYKNYKSSFL